MRENPILSLLSKIADLILLNVLVFVGCIPVITAGAAITAGHFTALRIKREKGTVFRDFCCSFKENFKQATAIWVGILIVILGVVTVLWFYGKQSVGISVACVVVLVFVYAGSLWVFPVLSKFVNTTGNTVRNGILLCVRYPLHTLLMLVVYILPALGLSLSLFAFPVVLLCGISLPMYISAMLYNRVFVALEEEVEAKKKAG